MRALGYEPASRGFHESRAFQTCGRGQSLVQSVPLHTTGSRQLRGVSFTNPFTTPSAFQAEFRPTSMYFSWSERIRRTELDALEHLVRGYGPILAP
jgi:hypothetical protein